MTVAEAYKAGRAKARWTNETLIVEGGKSACAIGATAIGMGWVDPATYDEFEGVVDLRDKFNALFEDVKLPYKCDHAFGYDSVPVVIEHYSDHHRNGRGRDDRLVALMEKYALN